MPFPSIENHEDAMRPGQRCMVLDYPVWQGPRLWGYEGKVTHVSTAHEHPNGLRPYPGYTIAFDWWTKPIYLPTFALCPVYHDCEMCGYASWGTVATQDETMDKPFYHHFCAWCLPPMRKLAKTFADTGMAAYAHDRDLMSQDWVKRGLEEAARGEYVDL